MVSVAVMVAAGGATLVAFGKIWLWLLKCRALARFSSLMLPRPQKTHQRLRHWFFGREHDIASTSTTKHARETFFVLAHGFGIGLTQLAISKV